MRDKQADKNKEIDDALKRINVRIVEHKDKLKEVDKELERQKVFDEGLQQNL